MATESARSDRDALHQLLPLALLAAASGARTFTGVAALEPRSIVPVLALGEMAVDKLPNVPPRTAAPSLLGRVAAGVVIGAIIARRTGADPVALGAIGGLTSYLSAHATLRMRYELMEHLPALGAAVVEDAIVIAAAVAGAQLVRDG